MLASELMISGLSHIEYFGISYAADETLDSTSIDLLP